MALASFPFPAATHIIEHKMISILESSVFRSVTRLNAMQIVALSWIICFAYQSESTAQEKPDNREICSVFGVALANAEAIESGDVLFFDRKFYDGVRNREQGLEGETLEQLTFRRVVFDAKLGRFLILSREASEWLELKNINEENDGKTRVIRDCYSSIDFTNKTLFVKSGNVFVEPGWPVGGIGSETRGTGLVDPRAFGIGGMGLCNLEDSKRAFLDIMTGDRLDSFSYGKNGLEVEISCGVDGQNVKTISSYLFDSTINLPVEYGYHMVFPGGGTTIKQRVFCSWKEQFGLFLPVGLRTKRFSSFKGRDSEQKNGDLSHEITLHWFSINEPIPPDLFDKDVLKDSQRLETMLDPVKSNATSIVEILEKTNPKIVPPAADTGSIVK